MALFKHAINSVLTVRPTRIVAVGSDYGPQARVSGEIVESNGTVHKDVLWYMPGKSNAFNELFTKRVIAEMPATLPDGKDAPAVPLNVLVKEFQACASQPAGQKYPSLVIENTTSATTPTNSGPGVNFGRIMEQVGTYAGGSPAMGFKDALQASADSETGPAPWDVPNVAQKGNAVYSNALYRAIVDFVRAEIVPVLPFEPSPESFAAMVNTLYISADRKGGA